MGDRAIIAALKRIIDIQNDALATALGPDAIMQLVVEKSLSLIEGAAGASLVVPDDDGVLCRAAVGALGPLLGKHFPHERALSAVAASLKSTQFSENLGHDPRVNGSVSDTLGVGSAISAPLLQGTECVAVLNLLFARPRTFSSDELDIVSLAASVIAAAMRQAALLENARDETLRDHLTGIENRRAFDRDLSTLVTLAREHNVSLALAVLDLDDLKRINDEAGHDAGDAVLQRFAHLLEITIRSGDRAYRLGGDEFAILMQQCDVSCATPVLRRLEAAARRTEPSMRFSAGVAELRADDSPASFFSRADAVMYERKRQRKRSARGSISSALHVRGR